MSRRALLPLLAALTLGAADPGLRLDLRTPLGSDPAARIVLVPPGLWYGPIRTAQAPVRPPARPRGTPGATVEVLDFLPPSDPRAEAFAGFVLALHQRLAEAFKSPPPDNASVDLGILMATDPDHPEALDPAMVRSLQGRFNALPPSGMPVPAR